MTGGSVCQRSLVCPSKVQVSCVWDANCHISFYNSLAGNGPTRAAPGPFPEKGLDQKGQKVGYPPSALPPGTLKPYGVSLPFTRRFSPMRRGRTLAAPPSCPVGEHIVRPRLCRRFPLSCTAFHFFDSLPPRSKMTGGAIVYRIWISRSSASAGPRKPCRGGQSPWDKSHGDPNDFICSGGVNPPGIEVLASPKRSVTRPATTKKFPGPLDRGTLAS